MLKKLVIVLWIMFFAFASSFASYTISKKDYEKVNYINHKLEQIIEKKYPTKKYYYYKVIIDTIDGYLALHKVGERKKVMLLCVKTYFIEKMWYKVWNSIQVDIIE